MTLSGHSVAYAALQELNTKKVMNELNIYTGAIKIILR